jgi:hypothetical protein
VKTDGEVEWQRLYVVFSIVVRESKERCGRWKKSLAMQLTRDFLLLNFFSRKVRLGDVMLLAKRSSKGKRNFYTNKWPEHTIEMALER